MKSTDFHITKQNKLDRLMVQLCKLIVDHQKRDPELYGMVAAGVLDPENRMVAACNYLDSESGKRRHAERAAIDAYTEKYGQIPEGSIILTTLSPCSEHMDERYGESCTDLINQSGVHKVYAGYEDPTQHPEDKLFHTQITRNKQIQSLCKDFADTFLKK